MDMAKRSNCCVIVIVLCIGVLEGEASAAERQNVLFINVDDMSCDSLGVYGCETPEITPNLDRLAAQGMRFEHAHVTVAICQPTRAVWLTGQWPHHSGALGFNKINAGVPTMPEALRKAGYLTGCFAKLKHMIPSRSKEAFEVTVQSQDLKTGRGVAEYYKHTTAFLKRASELDKPFFLAACIQDPHRPFAGSAQEASRRKRKSNKYSGGFPDVNDAYEPNQVQVPGFLPDLQPIRKELAEYYTSVHRADEIVGAILRALSESGLADDTVVIFMSDHGMPLPFAKTNCWRHSTRTPWIVRWPGVVKAGAVDREHVIAGIDLSPTVLDIAGLEPLEGQDGMSIRSILEGKRQSKRDYVYTYINTIASKKSFVMRAVNGKQYGYIWNQWSDGKTRFRNESMGGLTYTAMRNSVADARIAARHDHLIYRTPEEFYDYEVDPDALNNLAKDPGHMAKLAEYRELMLKQMKDSQDPQLAEYQQMLRK